MWSPQHAGPHASHSDLSQGYGSEKDDQAELPCIPFLAIWCAGDPRGGPAVTEAGDLGAALWESSSRQTTATCGVAWVLAVDLFHFLPSTKIPIPNRLCDRPVTKSW